MDIFVVVDTLTDTPDTPVFAVNTASFFRSLNRLASTNPDHHWIANARDMALEVHGVWDPQNRQWVLLERPNQLGPLAQYLELRNEAPPPE